MRVLESLYGVPERIELFGAICADLRNGGLVVDKLAVLEDRYKKLSRCIVLKDLALPCNVRIEDLVRLA